MEVGALILQANQNSFNEESPLEEGMSSTTNQVMNLSYIPTLAEEVADFIIDDNTKRKQKNGRNTTSNNRFQTEQNRERANLQG